MREASPTPIVPTTSKFAFQYTIPEQFEYVKPVLVAVLQQRYGPARNRHEAFMGSAASRRRVCDSNHSKGNLRALEVEELDVTLRRWVRRRQKRQELGLIPLDEPDNVSVQQSPSTRAMVCLSCSAFTAWTDLAFASHSHRKTPLTGPAR